MFTVVLFVFNCGLVYKATGELTDSPTVMALDSTLDYVKFNNQEIVAAHWVSGARSGATIYADAFMGFAVSRVGATARAFHRRRLLVDATFWILSVSRDCTTSIVVISYR